ncbi:hypothetical protein DFP83_10122 [Idiomarina fontislapidosi]|uniref:SnoaL-like domain-containing protein n=1 Tax=Idiomarina fontislapidosi TaxID=263723 RepID=A0A432YAT6_9GAMM|nr:nuclear transport factor 2 family protein [Idiomarina fontislapidosi]PYE35148.1 hypothetical protein DFP83_10122 [Idiomarina fontislapidosi]RUO58043.1 hypothetical protein CWE25_00125 [Idiomarina fontislapidosi]
MFRKLTLICCVLVSSIGLAQTQAESQLNALNEFITAFNNHDATLMAQYVSDDVQWLSVSGDELSVEVEGKQALIDSMQGYFKSCSSCQSQIGSPIITGSRISVVEHAHWQQNGKKQSQQSLAVYEFDNHLISRVYYFPTTK